MIYISSFLQLIVYCAAFVVAYRYLSAQKFMPYQEYAIGVSWDALSERLQATIIAMLRVCGAGILAVALCGFVLTALNYFEPSPQAAAIALIPLFSFGIPVLIAMIQLQRRTGAVPPIKLLAALLGIGGLAFLASLF